MQKFDIHEPGGVDADAAEADILAFVNSQPDGTVVLASVLDSAEPCKTNCSAVLSSIGGTGQPLNNRGISLNLSEAPRKKGELKICLLSGASIIIYDA